MKWLVGIPVVLVGLGVALFVGCVVVFALGVAAVATFFGIAVALVAVAMKLLFPVAVVLLVVFLLARMFSR